MKSKIQKFLISFPALVLVIAFVTVPAQAEQGSGDTSSTTTRSSTPSSVSTKTEPSGSDTTTTDSRTSTESTSHDMAERAVETENEQQGKQMLADARAKHKEKHTDQQRKSTCQGLQHGLATKLSNLNKNAEKHLADIDSVLAKVVNFQKSNGSDSGLLAKAQAAQAQAQSSVTALKALNVSVNCDDPNVAQTVATFKAAATKARTDLLAYRDSVKAFLQSEISTPNSTAGGSQ